MLTEFISMIFFIGYVVGIFVCGAYGSYRKIGTVGAFLLAIVCSPFLAMLFVMASKRLDAVEYEKAMYKIAQETLELLKKGG